MKKYTSQFNELIVLAEKNKKKGGSLSAIFKLVQDIIEFEDKLQEAINAQEMTENAVKIEAFVQDIDRMYDVLLGIAKEGIIAARSQRALPEEPEVEEAQEAKVTEEPKEVKDDRLFSYDDLKKQLDLKPKAPITMTIPKPPEK